MWPILIGKRVFFIRRRSNKQYSRIKPSVYEKSSYSICLGRRTQQQGYNNIHNTYVNMIHNVLILYTYGKGAVMAKAIKCLCTRDKYYVHYIQIYDTHMRVGTWPARSAELLF